MENSTSASDLKLVIVLNGEAVVEYDRSVALPERQAGYLDRMDEKMSRGIRLGPAFVEIPDQLQRAQFVATQLHDALRNANDAVTAASCAWLARRIPELRQVRIEDNRQEPRIDLVFDRDYVKEVVVDLPVPRKNDDKS